MAQQENALINLILLHMVDPVVVFEEDDRSICYANPAWETLTGYPLNKALGLPAFFPESDSTPEPVLQAAWETLLAGNTWRGRLKGKRTDETLYHVEAAIAPAQGESSRYFVCTMHEVLPTAPRSELLTEAAHDLRSPLSSLKLRLYLLGKMPERHDHHFGAMEALIEQISDMTDNLILLSDLGYGAAENKPVNMNDVIKRVAWAYWPIAQDKGLGLIFDITHERLPVQMDSDHLERVVVSQIVNALNFTPVGGKIRLTASQTQGEAVFAVHHSAGNVEEQAINLGRFYHIDESRCLTDDTWLEIVNAIVKKHGGRIESENVLDQERVIRVYLPLAPQ